jgi:malonate transporter and related proteins
VSDLVGLFNLLAPFYGLIGLGFLCGRLAKRPAAGLAWMQFFLIYVSLPCLFYTLIAEKPLHELANWPFVIMTTLCTAFVFTASLATGLWLTRGGLAEAVIQGVAGSYSNIGYMGPPLILSAIGPAASAPVALIFVFDSLLLFSLVPLLMAVAGVEKRSMVAAIADAAWKVVSHPFNIATAVGVLASSLQLKLPTAAATIVTWLSGAAAPCALFLLGVTVALRPLGRVPDDVPVLVFIKLVLHPLVVWAVLSAAGHFDPTWIYAAVLMAALPPALNIFVIATQYDIGVKRASACVLLGTLVSIVTLTAFLWFINTGRMPADLFP